MTDCVQIVGGKAHQVWPDTTKAALCFRIHDGEQEPRAIFPQVLIDAIVEVESGSVVTGQLWSGEGFDPLPETVQPRRLVPKSVIVARLIAANKLAAARAALDAASLEVRERWNAAAAIYADDETALALLGAIGADAEAIMAPAEA